jgi:hypothetical protein
MGTPRKTIELIYCALIFFVVFWVTFAFRESFTLPYSNPWGVIGPMAIKQYNPSTNILRFLALITLPSIALFFALAFRPFRKRLSPEPQQLEGFPHPSGDRAWMRALLLLSIMAALFLVAGSFYPYHSESMFFDNFHEGEALGPAIDFIRGKIPYRDTIFMHGPFQDPLRAVLAFALFGKSISSVRILENIMLILNIGVFSVSIFILFGRNVYYSGLSLGALLIIMLVNPFHLSFIMINRDLGLWLFIIVAALLHDVLKTGAAPVTQSVKSKVRILFFLFGLIPMLALVHSVDRGFFLLAASLPSSLLLYLCHFRKIDGKSMLFHGFGYVLGFLVLGASIHWAYSDFFLYNVVIMPQYKGLMDGKIYPFERTRFILPILFMAVMVYFLALRLIKSLLFSGSGLIERLRSFYVNYFLEITLVMVSIFYYRSPLGRADIVHVRYVSAPLFIAAVYVVVKHYVMPLLSRPRRVNYRFIGTGAIAMLLLFAALYSPEINWKEFYRFPVRISDEHVVPKEYRETAAFLKSQMADNESFFSMTNDASWYYLVDKPCPSRFLIVWLAMPYFFQDEVIRDLKARNVKYILYKSDTIWMSIDGITNERRLPILVAYIKDNYTFFRNIHKNEIWIRK